jgi:hypothetical protein
VATKATQAIPIVGLDLESDPVAKGWVTSLARPGGNVTGIFLDIPEMSGKQLQFLSEAVPKLERVAVLGDPRVNDLQFSSTEAAARRLVRCGSPRIGCRWRPRRRFSPPSGTRPGGGPGVSWRSRRR